jgi:hypothetical protein
MKTNLKKISIASLLALCWVISSPNAEAQSTQSIRGQVLDESSKSPLPGVNVTVISVDPIIGASTDLQGNFRITGVPIGRHTLKISFIGYEDRIIPDVIITAGKEAILNQSISEAVTQLNEVVVSYDRTKDKKETNNEMSLVSTRSFNLDETKKYAGALGDPARMAGNFAGVVPGNDSRNDIIVRGNSPLGVLWQIEGLNAPNPNHFGTLTSTGGPVSIINTNNIDKSDFSSGAFAPQYGNATAAAFDLRLRRGNDSKREYLGQVGFNGFEGGIEGPFVKGKKATYLVNYRYSTLGVFKTLGFSIAGSAVPLYQDLNYKLFFPVGKNGELSIFGLNGNSSIDFLGKDVDTTAADNLNDPFANTKVSYFNTINGLSYKHKLGANTTANLSLGYTSTGQEFRGDSLSKDQRVEYRNGSASFYTKVFNSHLSINHKINARNSLSGGIFADLTDYSLQNRDFENAGTKEVIFVNSKGQMLLSQAYLQWKHRFGRKVQMVTGVHAQHLDFNNDFYVEPRLAFRYDASPLTSFNLGYGLHSQAQNVYNYFIETQTSVGRQLTNRDMRFTKSHHVVLTADRRIGENTRLKVEPYYQYLFDIPVEQRASSFAMINNGADFAPVDNDSLVNKGTGTNVGVELTLERYFSKGFYYLITGSVFESKYKGSDGVERNTAFNTRYVLNVLAGKEFKVGRKGNVLAINFKVATIGGRYLTPIDLQASGLAGRAVFLDNRAFTERQTPYFRSDLKISYRKEMKSSTLELALDLQNVTNNQNVFNRDYNPGLNKVVTNLQQGFFPVPMVRYTF